MRQVAKITACVFTMCAVVRADPPERQRDSPHESVSIHVFVTPDGAQPLRDGAADYPLGTIILKQKLIASATEMFTGMLKREPGYNPECGDWEFFTLSGDAGRVTARGRIDSCMSCHVEYEETGFIARDYPVSVRPRLVLETGQPIDVADRWDDADLVRTAVQRESKMVCVTREPFDDLDPIVIADCRIPSAAELREMRRVRWTSIFPIGGGQVPVAEFLADTDADTVIRTEERIFVTSNNEIGIDPLPELPLPESPPPGVTSEFFGTIGQVPRFSDQPEVARILRVDGIDETALRITDRDQSGPQPCQSQINGVPRHEYPVPEIEVEFFEIPEEALEQPCPRILPAGVFSGPIETVADSQADGGDAIDLTEERIVVTSDNQIDLPQEYRRSDSATGEAISESFFSTRFAITPRTADSSLAEEWALPVPSTDDESPIYRLAHEDQFNNRPDGIDASAFSGADVGNGPLLWFVHPEDVEGNSVRGGGPRDEVIYVYDPTGDEPPQEIWRGQNPQPKPVVRLNANQLLIEYRHRSIVLHLDTGKVSPHLSGDNQSKFLKLDDGKLFFLERTVPYVPYGYQLGNGGPGVTVLESYYRPRDYLYVFDVDSTDTVQLLDVAVEKVISTERDVIWAITAGRNRRLCRISKMGELEEIVEIDDHLMAPELHHAFSPSGRFLALSYLHDQHDFHSERELLIVDVEEKRVAYSHEAVPVGYPPAGFAQGSAPSLSFRWLDDTHLSYGLQRVVDAGRGVLVAASEAERLHQLHPLRREPSRETVRYFDRKLGRLYFPGEEDPVASVLKEGSGRVSDLEVSGNGEWAAFSSPEDSNTYVIDGPNRIKSLLMEGWSYNIRWLPGVAESG